MENTVLNDQSLGPFHDIILFSISRTDPSGNSAANVEASFKQHSFGTGWDARYAAGDITIVSQYVYKATAMEPTPPPQQENDPEESAGDDQPRVKMEPGLDSPDNEMLSETDQPSKRRKAHPT